MDYLLIGWKEIHEALFFNKQGKQLISINTLRQKYGPDLKASGIIVKYRRTKARTPCVAGWESRIINHFTKLGQLEDAERVKKKANKKRNKETFN